MRLLALLALLAGCMPVPQTVNAPLTQAAPREATPVNAAFERTWGAVIDQLAEQNLNIRVLDKSSGWVATQTLRVGEAWLWADCGSVGGEVAVSRDPRSNRSTADTEPVVHIPTEQAEYDVVVHGDSVHSTVRVSVHWTAVYRPNPTLPGTTVDCVTKGVWERAFETTVKQRAEKR